MAYYRPSLMQSLPQPSQDATPRTLIDDIKDNKQKRIDANGNKTVQIFGLDISNCSPIVQYVALVGGFIFFMCFYGYYQELVVYGWFQRKLSLFSTFLHFFGCLIFAQIQKYASTSHLQLSVRSDLKPKHVFAMGTASFRAGIFFYMLIVLLKTSSQGLSNLSMTHINYTAKVLFKSAQPVVTILIGTVWFRRSYPMKDYIIVVLLMLGLFVFISGKGTSPESTTIGLIYVTFSMLGSAAVPMVHEHVIQSYNVSVDDLTYHSFLGSTLVSLALSLLTHEFKQGILFLWASGSVHTWFVFIAFTSFGFIGAVFSITLTAHYGALLNGITNTFRKAMTLALSFALFPERNELTNQKIVGACIFFSGLIVQLLSQTKYMQSLLSYLDRQFIPNYHNNTDNNTTHHTINSNNSSSKTIGVLRYHLENKNDGDMNGSEDIEQNDHHSPLLNTSQKSNNGLVRVPMDKNGFFYIGKSQSEDSSSCHSDEPSLVLRNHSILQDPMMNSPGMVFRNMSGKQHVNTTSDSLSVRRGHSNIYNEEEYRSDDEENGLYPKNETNGYLFLSKDSGDSINLLDQNVRANLLI